MMDSSAPTQEADQPPSEEQIQLEQPPSTDTTLTTNLSQPGQDTATVAPSGLGLPRSEEAPRCTSSSPPSVVVSSHAPVPDGQTGSYAAPCSFQTSGASGAVTADLHTAEEGVICDCQAPNSPSQTQDISDSPAAVSIILQTETERPGLSRLPPAGPSQHCAVDSSSSPHALPVPASLPGSVCGRASCCAAPSQPCHVLSLPDMRRPHLDCEVADQSGTPAAASSSDPAPGQVSMSRPSASSGVRAALQSVASHTSFAFASPLSSIGPFCRICHEGESREQLISPCRCAGSVGLVHVSCIEKWLSAANKDSCEICMYRYVTERRPKPLLEWLLHPSNPEDARNLVGDVICFFLLTALAVIAAYLCLMGASHYLAYKTQWEATGLVVLGLLISSIYCVWLVVTCRYHCRVWQDWRRTHQDVHLLQMKRISHSAVDLNNNIEMPAPPGSGLGPGCRACRGGSYSCGHCCSVCPVHGVPMGPASAGATLATTGADGRDGADGGAGVSGSDGGVFDDTDAGDVGGGVCGAAVTNLEDEVGTGAKM